ncbi:MAG: glutathione transport system permease protein [Gaiellaceae bacterium]|jgi:peptide/nickel transport system permease protein|nr:glutathione transport system permease protein [Gaiellaceae bacterium]
MASHAGDLPLAAPSDRRRRGLARFGRAFVRQPVALGAGVVLVTLFLIGLIVPTLVPAGRAIHLTPDLFNRPPTLAGWHWFGTNSLGQDVLQQSIHGLHATELIAMLGTLLATLAGVAIGGLAAYRGGWVDAALMRTTDALGILPAIFIVLIFNFYATPVTTITQTMILALCLWIPVARVVRAEVVGLRGREFAQAAVALGASDTRVFFRHLLPNASSTIIIAGTSLFGQLLLLEATVEFLGLGESQLLTNPTLGSLIGYGKVQGLGMGWGWWTWSGPAFLLVLVLVCANLFGDGVAQALRPTARR